MLPSSIRLGGIWKNIDRDTHEPYLAGRVCLPVDVVLKGQVNYSLYIKDLKKIDPNDKSPDYDVYLQVAKQ